MSNLDWETPDQVSTWQRRRHLIIGQAPARSALPDTRPWDSASGRLLAARAGTSLSTLLELCDTTNLNCELRTPPEGLTSRWDPYDELEAAERAQVLRDNLWRWTTVLCCGSRVVAAMGAVLNGMSHPSPHTAVFGIIHPGGTNRALNDPSKRRWHEATIRAWWSVAYLSVPA